MNPPDPGKPAAAEARRFEPAGRPRGESGPVFAEPWKAQAFALAVRLYEAGCFTWKAWAATLVSLDAMIGVAKVAPSAVGGCP